MKKRFSEEQIIEFLHEADAGLAVKELCRKHGFSEASYYLWRSKFGGMDVPDAKRLKSLEAENTRLRVLLLPSGLTSVCLSFICPRCSESKAIQTSRLRLSFLGGNLSERWPFR